MLRIENLCFRLGARDLLKGLQFDVRPGAVTAVVGPNGAGKSTLLKLLSGELTPQRGHIAYNGIPLTDWPRRDIAGIRAVMPQHSALAFPFTVAEVVSMGRSPHLANGGQRDEEIVLAAMQAANIRELAQRRYPTLSGGERQRTHLARALAQIWDLEDKTSGYLLLDEPTSALDLTHQHRVLMIARRFAISRRIGVVAVLHDVNLAASYADAVVLLHEGRQLACGHPDDVLIPTQLESVFGLPMQSVPVPNTDRRTLVVTPASAYF